jgi:hypothetical protein
MLITCCSTSVVAQTTFGTGTQMVIPLAANISVYHTSVFVRNPNAAPILVNVKYYQSINGAPPAGLRSCTPLSLQANQSSSFDLGVACGLTGANDDFGMIILEDSVGTNPFFAYSRTQTPSGIGFSVEGFPVSNFTGASAEVLGLQKVSAAPNYRSNCFIGALGQQVHWQMQLIQGGAETVLATTSGLLSPYQFTRILDIFTSLGLAGDFANVRAIFTTSDSPAPPFLRFCTLETSANGSADFRIAKSNIGSVANAFVQNGNAFGTTAKLGTTENQPLELFVNNQRVMRYDTAATSNIIGGHPSNIANALTYGQTIAGGGEPGDTCPEISTGQPTRPCANRTSGVLATVSGGSSNFARLDAATVSGGIGNTANGPAATVSGGYLNIADRSVATVSGGQLNHASGFSSTVSAGEQNVASGDDSTVSGGITNTASGDSSFVGGGESNTASGGTSVVAGGSFNTVSATAGAVGGGAQNTVSGPKSTVAGGWLNQASGDVSAVGGGVSNKASGTGATVAGGDSNWAALVYTTVAGGVGNLALGNRSTISGGETNTADGLDAVVAGGGTNQALADFSTVGGGSGNQAKGHYATVVGGISNLAGGFTSLAAGTRAKANGDGSFVWSDGRDFDFVNPAGFNNVFAARATGGAQFTVGINSTTGNPTWSCTVFNGGSWACTSDRNAKENFAGVNGEEILDRLATLSLSTWNGKGSDPRDRHLGPMAQDFHALFGLGTDDTKIASADLSGVGLAAIQGLYQRLRVVKAQAVEQQATIDAQQNDIAELKRRVDELQTLRAELTALRQAMLEPM